MFNHLNFKEMCWISIWTRQMMKKSELRALANWNGFRMFYSLILTTWLSARLASVPVDPCAPGITLTPLSPLRGELTPDSSPLAQLTPDSPSDLLVPDTHLCFRCLSICHCQPCMTESLLCWWTSPANVRFPQHAASAASATFRDCPQQIEMRARSRIVEDTTEQFGLLLFAGSCRGCWQQTKWRCLIHYNCW